MKAVIINEFGGVDKLTYTDIHKPMPKDDEVLVKNSIIGVGKPDYMVRSGIYPYLEKQPPNLVIGNECAGYVEAVGKDVDNIKVGDAVWVVNMPGYGAYAEYICVNQKFVTVLPDSIPFEKAVGLGNYFVAYSLLHEAGRGTDGQSLYILGGAGGVGTALIKLALKEGWEVISGADTDEKCEYLISIGTTHVFNSTKIDQYKAVKEFTNQRGVDLLFDQWVGENFYKQFDLLADFGMVVVYNWLEGSPNEDFFPHMVDQAIHSTAVRIFSSHIYDNKPERLEKIKNQVFELIASGEIIPEIYDIYQLSDVKKAHQLLDEGKITGKLLLKP